MQLHPADSGELVRQHAQWPGNNRFFCGGRVMVGPSEDWPYNLCAWSSILIPSTAYFRFVVPKLWGQLGPGFPCAPSSPRHAGMATRAPAAS
eukprot:SAG11_NODE_7696_length_1108_cov_2.469772_1_plen_92_part_00